jgi:Lrp/AsnC family transcriptional regulator
LLETHSEARGHRCDHRRVALLDPARIGLGLTVFVAVEAGDHTPGWLESFSSSVSAMPEVMDFYRMAGETDYMLRVVVADMAEFDSFYKRLIATAPLKNVTSRFAMERLKQTTAYPLQTSAFRDRRQVGDREVTENNLLRISVTAAKPISPAANL